MEKSIQRPSSPISGFSLDVKLQVSDLWRVINNLIGLGYNVVTANNQKPEASLNPKVCDAKHIPYDRVCKMPLAIMS